MNTQGASWAVMLRAEGATWAGFRRGGSLGFSVVVVLFLEVFVTVGFVGSSRLDGPGSSLGSA